nr:MAG TPA: hypothetical protein [Caudoviricetes sp.]
MSYSLTRGNQPSLLPRVRQRSTADGLNLHHIQAFGYIIS